MGILKSELQAIQIYVTNLVYLSQEAKRDGLNDVSQIIQRALSDIELWINAKLPADTSHQLLDLPLCHALEFMMHWSTLSKGERDQAVQLIKSFEEGETPEERDATENDLLAS